MKVTLYVRDSNETINKFLILLNKIDRFILAERNKRHSMETQPADSVCVQKVL